jgi:putative transposase
VTKTRSKSAALKFLKKMLKWHGRFGAIVTGRHRSLFALKELAIRDRQETDCWANNSSEAFHLPTPRREWAMLRFCRMRVEQNGRIRSCVRPQSFQSEARLL